MRLHGATAPPAPPTRSRADTRVRALGTEPLRPLALARSALTRSFRLAIVSPDRGDNQIKAGCSASGDQPLFTEARQHAASGVVGAARWGRLRRAACSRC